MPSYDIFKPSPALYLTGEWDKTRVRDLPEFVGSYPLRDTVCDEIGAALLERCGVDEDIGEAYEKATASRLADLLGQIDVERIMDEWAEAATFDPARVTTTKAAWVLLGKTNFAIVEAELVDSDSSPNGKDWATHAYTYTRDGWTGKRPLSLQTPGHTSLGEHARNIADIARLFTDGPRDVVAANLENALQTKEVDAVGVTRVMVKENLEDYLDGFLEDFLDKGSAPEAFDLGHVPWEDLDAPVIPNVAREILLGGLLDADRPILGKAGPYNVRIEAIWQGSTPFVSAKITVAPEPGFDYEQTILESTCPILRGGADGGLKTAALEALRDLLDREGFTRFDSIEINDREHTNDFDVLLEQTKLGIARATLKFPHPLDLERVGEDRFVFEKNGVSVIAVNHDDEVWSITSSCAGQPPRTDYGWRFEEAYTNAFEAQNSELSLRTDDRLCINDPGSLGRCFYTEPRHIDLWEAEKELYDKPVTGHDAAGLEVAGNKSLASEIARSTLAPLSPAPARATR